MDVWSIVILAAAAWVGVYILTVLIAQHRRQLLEAWKTEQNRQERRQQSDAVPDARPGPEPPPAQAGPTAATPDRPTAAPDPPRRP